MEKNKIIIIIMAIVILMLFGYIAYDKLSNKSIDESTETESEVVKNRTMTDVVGKYIANFEVPNDEQCPNLKLTLTLHDNGIFTYVHGSCVETGILGNYYLNGDEIVLTNWFHSNSGTDLGITKGTKILKIEKDGTIVDDNVKMNNYEEIKKANLTKTGDAPKFDISNRLAAAFFSENNHTILEPGI